MKVACITEQVLTLVNKRLGLYRHFDETINKYKQSRDVSTLNSGKKSLETEHKAVTSEIAVLQSRLKTEGSDLCDRVSISVVNHLSVALHAPFRDFFCLLKAAPILLLGLGSAPGGLRYPHVQDRGLFSGVSACGGIRNFAASVAM